MQEQILFFLFGLVENLDKAPVSLVNIDEQKQQIKVVFMKKPSTKRCQDADNISSCFDPLPVSSCNKAILKDDNILQLTAPSELLQGKFFLLNKQTDRTDQECQN